MMNSFRMISMELENRTGRSVCLCNHTKTLEEAIALQNKFQPESKYYGCKRFRLMACVNHGRGARLVPIYGTERYTKDDFLGIIEHKDCIDDNQPLITAQEMEYEKEWNALDVKRCQENYQRNKK